MRMIQCKTCGKDRPHAAHGLCKKCDSARRYKDDNDRVRAQVNKYQQKKISDRHHLVCERLREMLLEAMPGGCSGWTLTWSEAAMFYTGSIHIKNRLSPQGIMYAVRNHGDEYGMKYLQGEGMSIERPS